MIDTYLYNYPELVRHPEPFAKINAQGANIKIAIIGSGFTGATASYELKRALGNHFTNKNITFYEARTQDNIKTKDHNEQAA